MLRGRFSSGAGGFNHVGEPSYCVPRITEPGGGASVSEAISVAFLVMRWSNGQTKGRRHIARVAPNILSLQRRDEHRPESFSGTFLGELR